MRDLIIVGGPNGAGKTTFAQDYLTLRPLRYLSADAIAAELSPEDPARARIQAGKEFSRQLREAIRRGESLVIESTLAGRTLERFLKEAKHRGYYLEIIFIFLETAAACLHRVRERVKIGGHFVAEEDVVRRFHRSKENFWNVYQNLAERWYLFSNSEDTFCLAAFSQNERCEVSDEDLFSTFFTEEREREP